MNEFVTTYDLTQGFNVSRTSIYNWSQRSDFPKPECKSNGRDGKTNIYWLCDIRQWAKNNNKPFNWVPE